MIRMFTFACGLFVLSTLNAEEPKKEKSPSPSQDSVPRYRLTPGRELSYEGKSSFTFGQGPETGEHRSRDEWTIWVLRANSDGSTRLLCRHVNQFIQLQNGKEQHQQSQTDVVYADLFPDGRILPNPSIRYRGSPEGIFPPLPKDRAEAKAGWESISGDRKRIAKPDGDEFTVQIVDLWDKIYLSTNNSRYTFDAERGLISKMKNEYSQGYGFKGKGTGNLELIGEKTVSAEDLKKLVADTDRYFDVTAAYDDALRTAQKLTPEKCQETMTKLAETQKAAADAISQPDLKKAMNDKIQKHDQMAKYAQDESIRRDKFIGKPAHSFKAVDLKDKSVTLEDLRGKVVVLDFWYRGCGWCIKAMPQINQLTTDFTDKPVAILGMNTDSDKEDAEFVVKEMALKYPTLRIEHEMASKFGVQGFPTLVLIDKKGVVRDLHVGYSPTLREEVGKAIQQLLAE